MEASEYKSCLDKAICVEVYIHQKKREPLCLDCQQYWDSWNELERQLANATGKRHYTDTYGLGKLFKE